MKRTVNRSKISEGLKRARTQYNEGKPKELRITQETLAEKLTVSTKTVMNWEQGQSIPSLDVLMKLANLYHCDLDYLTGRIDCKTHDLQFIHDQTGLSERAIKKLQDLNSIPDYKNIEDSLREDGFTEDRISKIIDRQRERRGASIAREYPRIISLLIEDLNMEYLLSLIAQRVKEDPKYTRPLTPKEILKNDVKIELNGQRITVQKHNLLDSLIQSEVAHMIPFVSEAYHSTTSFDSTQI